MNKKTRLKRLLMGTLVESQDTVTRREFCALVKGVSRNRWVEVERLAPMQHNGVACGGLLKPIRQKITYEAFKAEYGGGHYRLLLRGPKSVKAVGINISWMGSRGIPPVPAAAQSEDTPKPERLPPPAAPHRVFTLSVREDAAAERFRMQHRHEVPGLRCLSPASRFTYTFRRTSEGTVVSLACTHCGEHEDITDYESW